MEIVLFVLISLLRILVIWQMAEVVKNLHTGSYKGAALAGAFMYFAYVIYTIAYQVGIPAEGIFSLIAHFFILLAVNKQYKKDKGAC